ncbi:Protein FAM73A [Fasciola gigantica]|uniref:Protein FAM73A n=1 Tax=Fasciola gigantica TaxID=46835 RepID=A0A504YS68_FASGI|nr:Protein FAM73A [Fasciola gigantica]
MTTPIITIRIPKQWKSTLWVLVTGGAVIGLSYLIWSRRDGRHRKCDEVMADLQSFPKLGRLPGVHRAPSQSSRNSTLNERRSVASVTRRALNQSIPVNHDSDADDVSTSSVIDWGRLGLRTLAGVVDHLEALMAKIRRYDDRVQVDTSSDSGQLINELRLLLEQAYQLREQYKRKLVLLDHDYLPESIETEVVSDEETCSYFSALEHIDLTELELLMAENYNRPIYLEALKLLDTGEIPYRSLRTQLVGCQRDIEYLAKLHCLRQALDFIFEQPEPTEWLEAVGRLSGCRLLHCLGYSTTEFDEAYGRLMSFVHMQRKLPNNLITEELSAKGIKVINFYDVVVDYMLLDSLELLSDPPSSVLAVTRHRWLSDNFKRVALDSTIWTILLAKRKLLKYADGFCAHYYTLVGTFSPALAWGFLGPDENAQRACNRFRETINAFLREAFVCRDTTATSGSRVSTFQLRPDISTDITDRTISGDTEQLFDEMEALELARRDDVHLDDSDEGDEGDDSSTVICRPSNPADDLNHTSGSSRSHPSASIIRKPGLRYTTMSELAEDLYQLFTVSIAQLTRIFREESRIAGNPIPDEWPVNPVAPRLRLSAEFQQ